MPPLTTIEGVRTYARLNFPKQGLQPNHTCEEYAHDYVHRLCCDSTMTMGLLHKILYRVTYKDPVAVEPCERAVYVEYLKAMQ